MKPKTTFVKAGIHNKRYGYKVWRWNKVYWAIFFVIPVAMTALIYIGYIPVLGVIGL